mmetsp:Transcript_22901/g.48036  ORF Transcript_22901/g.48036 Transcript_22901/m.48036 type:complete len:107 (-) Transcript_22901:162-482(-)
MRKWEVGPRWIKQEDLAAGEVLEAKVRMMLEGLEEWPRTVALARRPLAEVELPNPNINQQLQQQLEQKHIPQHQKVNTDLSPSGEEPEGLQLRLQLSRLKHPPPQR